MKHCVGLLSLLIAASSYGMKSSSLPLPSLKPPRVCKPLMIRALDVLIKNDPKFRVRMAYKPDHILTIIEELYRRDKDYIMYSKRVAAFNQTDQICKIALAVVCEMAFSGITPKMSAKISKYPTEVQNLIWEYRKQGYGIKK